MSEKPRRRWKVHYHTPNKHVRSFESIDSAVRFVVTVKNDHYATWLEDTWTKVLFRLYEGR